MTPTYSASEFAAMFKVSPEAIKNQYRENLKGLKQMYAKAILTGKKVNNYTEQQLSEMVARFEKLAA